MCRASRLFCRSFIFNGTGSYPYGTAVLNLVCVLIVRGHLHGNYARLPTPAAVHKLPHGTRIFANSFIVVSLIASFEFSLNKLVSFLVDWATIRLLYTTRAPPRP